MNLIAAALNSEVIGKRLGTSIYNSIGNLLLKKGVVIEPNFFSHLQEMGYRSIYLLGSDPNYEAISEGIPERLLVSMSSSLKRIFWNLQRQQSEIRDLKNELIGLAKRLVQTIGPDVERLPRVVSLKRVNEYLYQHSVSVAAYSVLIGRKLRYDDNRLIKLALSALLYDIGMMFMDPAIVNKSTNLEQREFEKVKTHPIVGFNHLVKQCSFDAVVGVPSMQHHERLDGHGYPNQLGGSDIHEYSRIVSLADFFDASTSDRPHRRLHSVEETFEIITRDTGKAFDSKMVEILMKLFDPE